MKHAFIAMVVLTILIVGYLILSQSDEEKIKIQFEKLSKLLTDDKPSNPIALANRVDNIKELFCPEVFIIAKAWRAAEKSTRDEIGLYALHSLRSKNNWELKVKDLKIKPSQDNAIIDVVITVKSTDARKKVIFNEEVKAKCEMKKINGAWLFYSFEDKDKEEE